MANCAQETLWRHRWAHILKLFKLRLHRPIIQKEVNPSTKFKIFISFFRKKILRFFFFLGKLAPWGPHDVTGLNFENLKFWHRHRIPDDEHNLNTKFQLRIPSCWEIMNVWSFWGEIMLREHFVTSRVCRNFEKCQISPLNWISQDQVMYKYQILSFHSDLSRRY